MIFDAVLIAVLAVPAAVVTAILALLSKRSRFAYEAPRTTIILVATIIPLLMGSAF